VCGAGRADADHFGTLGVAYTRDRHQHSELGDAGDEVLAQGCVVAHIVTDVKKGGVQVFERSMLDPGVCRFGAWCVGHDD
jgi:hypothetical protein